MEPQVISGVGGAAGDFRCDWTGGALQPATGDGVTTGEEGPLFLNVLKLLQMNVLFLHF